MDKDNEFKLPLRKPFWNIWQALFLISVVTLVEFFLGWLEIPEDLESSHGILSFVTIGLGDALLYFGVVLVFLKSVGHHYFELGFAKHLRGFVVLGAMSGFFLFIGTGLVGGFLINFLGDPAPQSFTLAVQGANSIGELILLFFLGVVVVPIKEEMIFRGLLYPPFRQSLGRGKGILLTGFLFAFIHLDIIRFLPLFIGGVVLTWLYEKYESLWPGIIAHGVWNLFMALALWLQYN